MKPGEYIGTDGKTYTAASVALLSRYGEMPTATIALDGGASFLLTPHLCPGHPDFPAAAAALQALIPEKEPFWWELDGARFRWDGKNIQSQTCHEDEWRPCIDGILAAFEAGRCYQRERGDE